MNIFSKIHNFSNGNTDEFLAFSFAFLGESLIKSAEKEVFRPQKISSVHYNVLCALSIVSPRPAGEISSFILGSSANFSAILGRMEKEGLISRKQSEKNKREVLVSVTEKGKKIFKKTRKKFQEYFSKRFSGLSDEKKEKLSKILLGDLSSL